MFLLILTYKKPIDLIEKHLTEHVEFLDKYYENGKLIFSGRRNSRIGGVIMVNSEDEKEVSAMIEEDPFYKNDLANYEIIEFIPTKYDMRFKDFI